MDQPPISLKEAADRYEIKLDRLRRAVWDGRLMAQRDGVQWFVRPAEVERFIHDNGRAPRIEPAPRRQGAAAARVIAVAIPKGGTGKTTTTLNLGAALAERGQRVLLIDCDPQGSLTVAMGCDPNRLEYTLQDAIEHYTETFESTIDRAILTTEEGIDLVPATARLNKSNTDLHNALAPQQVLGKLVAPLRTRYDLILIDTLPYLGVLVQNALVAADEVLIPLQAQALASESARLMVQHIQQIRRSGLNPRLRILGFLLTQVDPAATVQREYVTFARRTFGEDGMVFTAMIENRPVVQESQTAGVRQSLFRYRPTDLVTNAYRALAQEVINGEA
jgi:chromosome partitioning protein